MSVMLGIFCQCIVEVWMLHCVKKFRNLESR